MSETITSPSVNETVREITRCRACGSDALWLVVDLGEHAISDFYETPPADELKAPLQLAQCYHCSLVQLRHTVDRDRLYRNYWYKSGTNESMVAALRDVVEDAMGRVKLEPGDAVLDIGSNDSTLLDQYPNWLNTHGFEPAQSLAEEGRRNGHIIFPEFFPPTFHVVGHGGYKIITSIAMFYDLDDPNEFVAAIKKWLHPDGVWVVQLMDLVAMLDSMAFDNICHEHLEYYSLAAFHSLILRHGLRVKAMSRNKVNGGSVRFIVVHDDNAKPWLPTGKDQYRLAMEDFSWRIQTLKDDAVALLTGLKADGKTILGYGASTKGNTLLQYYGITSDLLPAIAERNADKWGKVTAGQHIPIISEQEMRERRPDYLLVLPWHFLDGFIERERELREQGTRFIVPLPELRIV